MSCATAVVKTVLWGDTADDFSGSRVSVMGLEMVLACPGFIDSGSAVD